MDQRNLTAVFVLYAFNEERFIHEAVASALAQSYSPLEIVLSDDGSTDRTYEIMQEMAASYRGPHKIILNRNERNIGIGSQLNAAYQKSQGELILLANGDDISLPERTARVVEAWLASNRKAQAITCNLATMDENGRRLPSIMNAETRCQDLEDGMRKRFGGVLAASLAITRDVFERFGPLLPTLILEDNPLYLRATLLGERIHLQEAYVLYRIHMGNISQAYSLENFSDWRKRQRQKLVWHRQEGVKAYLQMLIDLHSRPAEDWPTRDLRRARSVGIEKLMENAILRDYYANDDSVSRADWCRCLSRTGWLLIKLSLKARLPFIEKRNDRWHYQKLLEGSEQK